MEYILHSDDVFTLTGFMTPDECLAHIRRSEALGFAAAQIDTGRGMLRDANIRNNESVLVDDAELALAVFERSRHYFPNQVGGWRPCSLNERFRYYKYQKGHAFKWHRDGAFERNPRERSRMTFMIYLNEGFDGGETNFGDFCVNPRTGDALCFPHELMHEGRAVSSGVKYVLRTDVMYELSTG